MRPASPLYFALIGGLLLHPADACAQATADAANASAKLSISPAQLFESEDILSFTLSCDLREVTNDRGDQPQYHDGVLSYKNPDSSEVSLPLKTKVRGNFRRNKTNCFFPPLLLNFPKGKQLKTTVFSGQNKLKLVTHCQGDQYVIREYLVYKLFNLLTEKSFRARLVKVTYADTQHKRKTETHYGILLEDEVQMAERNKHRLLEKKYVRMEQINRAAFTKLLVFEYLIGNVDWSVPYLHNIKLLMADSTQAPIAAPYDFDHAGIVDAPYALPPEELGINSVRVRLYRGYCRTDEEFAEVFTLFNRLKNDFYAVYTQNKLLDGKYVKLTTRYLDDFYGVINNEKAIRSQFKIPCEANEKRNVVIKGLK